MNSRRKFFAGMVCAIALVMHSVANGQESQDLEMNTFSGEDEVPRRHA